MAADFYSTLGVPRTATTDEIKKAFRRLAKTHHPDAVGKDPAKEAKFKEISAAYEVLSDPKKRTAYDQYGEAASSGGMGGFDPSAFGQGGFDSNGFSGGGFADIFSTFFGENGGQARAQRGDDLQTELELTFEEAVRGATKEVSLRRTASCTTCSGSGAEAGSSLKSCDGCGGSGQVRRTQRTILGSIVTARPCPTCAGTGKIPEKRCGSCGGSGTTDARERLKVVVPAGVDDGQMIRLTGKGNAAPQIPAGDLYVRLRVRPSKEFVRDGLDIRSTVVISIPQAVLGDEISTTTVQGTVMVKIPAGTTSGTILRLRGKGVARHDGETGSHLLTIEIDVPKKLSRRQKELYEELREQG